MDNVNDNDNDVHAGTEEAASAPVATQSNLPLIITLVALITYFGFQTVSLLAERSNLGLIKGSQENALQEAQKTQAQFRTIVTKTGELADKGHGGAKMVMEGLQRQGMGMAGPTNSPEKVPDKAEAKPAK
jgi:hypothetical protein